ncbi:MULTISPECIES: GNAT family N-acetyltransferase [Clostridium]|uniref:GNAT family N-acetyltransferase n=1 Tax=Clostridium TaxID=1485 RepID=UPI000825A0EE|nr:MULTISPECIES: GNAT family N-acetyltransferase [Clostridium]PJI09401.1 N-acetyltransferase [Clostridium sp. CT7]
MKIVQINPHTEDALKMMEELSEALEKITGNSGKGSFNVDDISDPRAIFVLAYSDDKEPIGCGAIRPIDENTAEVKRMYAKNKTKGIGTKILCYLEEQAQKLGYSRLCLETRLINEKAVAFYEKRGYKRISNYGKYANRPEAVCFAKVLL